MVHIEGIPALAARLAAARKTTNMRTVHKLAWSKKDRRSNRTEMAARQTFCR